MIIYGWRVLGRAGLRTRQAACPRCGRSATLSSYVARRWFTLFFIPVVPLGRQHVSDLCGACKHGRFVPEPEWQARKAAAMEEAVRKAHAEPKNPRAQVDLLMTCLVFEEWEKAEAFLKRLEEGFPEDANVQVSLAQAYAYLGRPEESARALARAQALDPAARPAELPAPPLARGAGTARQLAAFAVVALLAVVAASAFSLYKSGHRTLHVVCGLDAPVVLEIEGEPPVTLSKGRNTLTLAEGRRRLRLTGAVEETVDVAIVSGFVERLFDDRTFILNPGGAAVLVYEEAAYAKRAEDAKGGRPPRLLYGRPVEILEGVDYVFAPFPREISTKSSGVTLKQRVDVIDDPPLGILLWLSANASPDDTLGFAEWALRSRPAERATLAPTYVSMARRSKQIERAVRTLRPLAAARPVDVEIHRAYQEAAGAASLIGEYDAELAKTPGDSALLYLRGRLESGIAPGLAWFEKARAADPANPWAHFAIGYGLASRGDWAAAVEALEKAVALQPANLAYRRTLRRARFGAGKLEDLEKELEEARQGRLLPYETAADLGLLRVLQGKTADALALFERNQTPFRTLVEADDLDDLLRRGKAAALYAAGDFKALAQLPGVDENDEPYERVYGMLELGEVDDALEIFDDPDATTLMAVALLQPDDAGALEEAVEAAESEDDDAAPLAKALRSGAAADVDAALDANVDGRLKAPALALLARRIPARAADLRAQAARLNTIPVFPHHLVKRALAP